MSPAQRTSNVKIFQSICSLFVVGLSVGLALFGIRERAQADTPSRYFKIKIVDAQTGRGVPLVELSTTNDSVYVTDSNGLIAFDEPGLMDGKVFFSIKSHGYEFPADGFGYRGVPLQVKPGGNAVRKVKRLNIAERICRLAGAGIYRDSILLGEKTPLLSPALSGQVMGQDSALAVLYKGKMMWFWGDTARPGYPLGNFHTTGAVATFPKGHTTAEVGLDFRYFTNSDGFAREMCLSKEAGPIWISGLAVITSRYKAEGKNEAKKEELYAYYARMEGLGKKLEHGFVKWDDEKNVFQSVKKLPLTETWRFFDGHPIRLTEDGITYLAGGFSFPVVRVPADAIALLDSSSYEAFTCLNSKGEVRRDAQGNALYIWQKEAPPLTPEKEAELIAKGQVKPQEAHFVLHDSAGKLVIAHAGSVTWNPWRKKWLFIATQKGAKESALGEIIYSEADSPLGPWKGATKIVTHDRYTFYNPVHHPFLDEAGGKIIYFEGTYTAEFSGNATPTPRYNYNQILYRLDLSDPRLKAVTEKK